MMFLPTLTLAMLVLADDPSALDVVSAIEKATTQAIARAQPSVVSITRQRGEDLEATLAIRGQYLELRPITRRVGPDGREESGFPGDFAAPGEFSAGVVIGDHGEILTTYHTLKGAQRIWVRGGNEEFEAEILAADPRSDLAVIAPREIPGKTPPRLPALKLGNATNLRPGTFLIAMGNSFNAGRDGQASASLGILANIARKLHVPPPEISGPPIRGQYFRYQPTLLQLDTKLNLGMSGGAVINMKGELVGLTTAAASPMGYDVQAGYAIPMDELGLRIANTLKQGKEVEYGFLGIVLMEDVPNGISQVGKDTPADKANLLAGDVIVAVNDRPLEHDDGVTMALSNVPAGDTVKLKIRRNGSLIETSVLVSKYPISGAVIATNRPPAWRGLRVDFTSALNPDGQNVMEAMSRGSIGVTEVETGSPVDTAGLKKGMVITEVDGQPVNTPAEFTQAVAKKTGKDVTLTTQLGEVPGQKVVVKK